MGADEGKANGRNKQHTMNKGSYTLHKGSAVLSLRQLDLHAHISLGLFTQLWLCSFYKYIQMKFPLRMYISRCQLSYCLLEQCNILTALKGPDREVPVKCTSCFLSNTFRAVTLDNASKKNFRNLQRLTCKNKDIGRFLRRFQLMPWFFHIMIQLHDSCICLTNNECNCTHASR